MTFEGLGEMFEGDFADRSHETFPLASMGEPAKHQAFTDVSKDPIGVNGIFKT